MISEHSKDLLSLATWLKPPNVSCAISRWVLDLLPEDIDTRKLLVKSALLVGCDYGAMVKMGQVSYTQHGAMIVAMSIKGPRAAARIESFGKEIYVVSKASILRTAIMLGLRLPRVELGVMSCTRTDPLSALETADIIDRAKHAYPEEFK